MSSFGRFLVLTLIFLHGHPSNGFTEDTPDSESLLIRIETLINRSPEKALELANEGIKTSPKDPRFYLIRGKIFEKKGKFTEALQDYNACLKIDGKNLEAYESKGSANFKLGRVKESARDFDWVVETYPQRANGHWQRGISLYYAGRYEDGKKQFEGYEKVDTNDVENAIWHFLCNARLKGIETARKEMLKIGKDRRIPMMLVYDLYRGKCKPEEVLEGAMGEGGNKDQQLFYAYLYLGIYYELLENRKKALECLEKAANRYKIDHYMGDVARVHWELLKQ